MKTIYSQQDQFRGIFDDTLGQLISNPLIVAPSLDPKATRNDYAAANFRFLVKYCGDNNIPVRIFERILLQTRNIFICHRTTEFHTTDRTQPFNFSFIISVLFYSSNNCCLLMNLPLVDKLNPSDFYVNT